MTAPKLTLYNSVSCPYAARAIIALAETNQEAEIIPIDLKVPRPEWYLKDINPYGQVPALKVNDKDVILESLIVAEYIIDLHPESRLLPTDPLQRAQTRYLIHHWSARVMPKFQKATYVLNAKQAAEGREELVVELIKFNKLLLDVQRKESDSEGPFYFGSNFTLADLAIAPFLARFFLIEKYNGNADVTLEKNPELKRFLEWREAVLARDSLQKATEPKDKLVENYRKFLKETW
ncbi:hypothetical protein BG011_008638 [Mortierella polycephala]|uniref:Glutathione S-transferase n=1 Tax=Mortierella polycephala TaxID=41804 RepID=A0A9P6PPS7_9FUNG|nr:hypothetical protein BG011_008638 [Mortierella polycephala]